jgi:hypothetical protein
MVLSLDTSSDATRGFDERVSAQPGQPIFAIEIRKKKERPSLPGIPQNPFA